MKKIILIIDILLILITMALFVYYGYFSQSYGLAALEDVGKFVICLLSLGVEAVILIILFILWLAKKQKNKQI